MKWRLGDGQQINIWTQPWLRVPNSPFVTTATPHGLYLVKSAYHHLMETMFQQDHLKVEGNWPILWKLDIPPKIKHFMWRSLKIFLPTWECL